MRDSLKLDSNSLDTKRRPKLSQSESVVPNVRKRVSDAFELVSSESRLAPIDPELVLVAIDTLGSLIMKKHWTPEEIEAAQGGMKALGSYDVAFGAFGTEGLRLYFQLLSGTDADHPFYFAFPIMDEDLKSYWDYDYYHNDPLYQDDIVLEYIDEEVETIAVNLLLSRLKANPLFYKKVVDDEKAKDAAGKGHITAFTQVVLDTHRKCESAQGDHPSPDTIQANLPLKKASVALNYFFYSKVRVKKVSQYLDLHYSGKALAAAKLKKEIRKLDCRTLEKVDGL